MEYQMKKVFLALAAALALLLPLFAQANVKCPDAKVQMLYPTQEKTFIQLEGQGWQVLGFAGDEDLETKVSVAMTAQRKGYPVELTFKNGHDKECLLLDESSPALYWLRKYTV